MILEGEAALRPATKEGVSVAFICNLRGFGLPSICRQDLAFTVVYRSGVPHLAKKERKLVAGGVYYAGTWLSNGRHTIGNNRNGRSA
jgi:hypothetical protein